MLIEWRTSLKVSREPVEIANDLHAVAIALLRTVRREDDALGLTSARLSALSVLVFGGPKTLGELAAVEQVSLPTMTRIAAALCKAGHVRRIIDPADRRYVRLESTRSGERLLEEGRRRRIARVAAIIEGLTPAELTACGVALDALHRAMAAKTA